PGCGNGGGLTCHFHMENARALSRLFAIPRPGLVGGMNANSLLPTWNSESTSPSQTRFVSVLERGQLPTLHSHMQRSLRKKAGIAAFVQRFSRGSGLSSKTSLIRLADWADFEITRCHWHPTGESDGPPSRLSPSHARLSCSAVLAVSGLGSAAQ